MDRDYRFTHRLKVRYSEIDGQKIVFNSHYMTYIDIAASEYFEEGLKLNLQELAKEKKFDFVLAKTTLEFKKPARLGDWLNISCRTKKMGRSSFTMEFVITKEGESAPLLTAETIYVGYDAEKGTSVPIPDFIRERIEQFENSETTSIKTN